jgi:HEAT repeat protein
MPGSAITGRGLWDSCGPLSNALAKDPAPQVRIAAADALGSLGGRRAVSVLAPFVGSEDADLARAALMALGRVGHPDALPPILSVLRSSPPSRRVDALRAISLRRDKNAVDALQWMAAADDSASVWQVAIEELGRMGTHDSVSALLRLASDRRLRELVITAVSALGPRHLDQIQAGLESPQLETRRAVVQALGRMRHPCASEMLKVALDDERPEVRLAALMALRRLGSAVPERKILSMAHGDPDPGVRQAAEQALQR